MSKIFSFFREVKAELEKVTWPKKDDLIGAVTIVCFLALVFAVIIGLMDSSVHMFIKWMIR
jgi:preprotein translocase subunit SecE